MDFAGILRPKGAAQASCSVRSPQIPRSVAVVVLGCVLLAFLGAKECLCAPTQKSDSFPDFRQLLHKFKDFSPDPCGPPHGPEEGWDFEDVEFHLFEKAADIAARGLNATASTPKSPQDRAVETLKQLEQASTEINAAWPEENRFHFQILDLPPALIVKMTFRTDARFFVFAVPEEDSGKPNRLWREVGSDEESAEHNVARSWLDLYPLHRGPSGKARFLAKFGLSGCAGSIGVLYDAREWDPKDIEGLKQIIKQKGALGLDDKVPGFQWIGELRAESSLITLPYCWFSAIDTWDNPSLCAVDTYDLSGDNIRFRSRTYNRPELVPVAKAIEYAQKRDYPAVSAYCASSQVAHILVRDLPPFIFADDLRVTHTGNGKEHVELSSTLIYRFEVEKRNDRWLVVALSME